MIFDDLDLVYLFVVKKMEKCCLLFVKSIGLQSTAWYLMKVLLERTVCQGTTYVESTAILSDTVPMVRNWANGNFINWAVVNNPFLNPHRFLLTTFTLSIYSTYAHNLFHK